MKFYQRLGELVRSLVGEGDGGFVVGDADGRCVCAGDGFGSSVGDDDGRRVGAEDADSGNPLLP